MSPEGKVELARIQLAVARLVESENMVLNQDQLEKLAKRYREARLEEEISKLQSVLKKLVTQSMRARKELTGKPELWCDLNIAIAAAKEVLPDD